MSESLDRKIDWKKGKKESGKMIRGKNYLLVIGIDQYEEVAVLKNAVRDAQAFVEVLLDKYHFERENLIELYNEEATYSLLDQAFRSLHKTIKPGDNLLIYFSGHGHYDEFYGDGYWLPVDANYNDKRGYFSYKDIVSALGKIASQHTFMVVDSCYSGAVLVENTRDIHRQDPREKDPSRWILASGRNEVVPDGVAGGHSPFSEQLLDTLSRYADEGISVLSLVDKVTQATIHNGKQKPIGRPIQNTGDKGGQFFFYPKAQKLPEFARPTTEKEAQSEPLLKKKVGKREKMTSRIVFALGYLISGIALIYYLLQPKEGLRILADLTVDEFAFEHQDGFSGFGSTPISSFTLSNYAHLNIASDSFQLDPDLSERFTTYTNPNNQLEIYPLEGVEEAPLSLEGVLVSSNVELESGAEVYLKQVDLNKSPGHIFLDVVQAQAYAGSMTFRNQLLLNLSYVELRNTSEEEFFIDGDGQAKLRGPTDGSTQKIRYETLPTFHMEFQLKDPKDLPELDIEGVSMRNPSFFRPNKDVTKAAPVSAVLSGSIQFVEKGNKLLKQEEIELKQELRFIGSEDLEINKLQFTSEGISLNITGEVEQILRGSDQEFLNPSRFEWLWHNQKMLFLLLMALVSGLFFILPVKLWKKFSF